MRRQLAFASAIMVAIIGAAVVVTPAQTAVDPIRAAFYYPWFPETEKWATKYVPTLGKYDSSNETVVGAHVAQAKYAGLDAFIASWWGKDSKTAGRLPLLLDVADRQEFKIAPYYEPASLSPTESRVKADFDALAARASHPAWLVVGKPVLFVYNIGTEGNCAAIAKYKTAAAGRFYLNMKVFSGYRSCSAQPDSWHQYGPASAYDQQDKFSATVSPGFYKFNEDVPRLARDLERFRTDLVRQTASGAQWQLTTSFNEFGEGTQVEPSACPTDATQNPVNLSGRDSKSSSKRALLSAHSGIAGAKLSDLRIGQDTATVPFAAMPFAGSGVVETPTADGIGDVVDLSPDEKVAGANAGRIVASMTDKKSVGDWPVRQLVGESVGSDVLRAVPEVSVISGPSVSGPFPAGVGVGHETPKAIGGVHAAMLPQADRNEGIIVACTGWQSKSGMGDYLDVMRAVYMGEASPPASPTESPTASVSPTESSASPTESASSSVSPTESVSESVSVSPTESTSPTLTADPVIAAAGDIACEPGRTAGTSCQHKAVSDKIVADKVDHVFALGDLQYDSGSLAGFQQSYDPTWGRFKTKTKPVPGNHEYGTAGAAGYFDYFGALAGDRAKGYYSFDVGSWHFVALNSEKDISATGAQVAWLKADLAANRSKCVGAFWHKPRWSTGLHGDHTSMSVFVKPLYDAGAELVLSGHDHSYERFQPVNPSGVLDSDKGIVQIVSGLGGRNHYSVTGRSLTAAKNNTSYGYTRITLHEDSAGVEFVPAVGTFTDSFKLTCH